MQRRPGSAPKAAQASWETNQEQRTEVAKAVSTGNITAIAPALVMASGDNGYGTMLVIQYIITIPLAIYALFFIPERGTRSPYMENLRRNSALFGLLPCGPVAIIMALVGVGIYYLRGKSSRDAGSSIAKKWSEGTSSSGVNPFGSSSPSQRTGTSSGNPFAGGGSGDQTPKSNQNPFDDGGQGSSGESGRPNPFA